MKNNQFAIRPTKFDDQIKELKEIGFLDKDNSSETDSIKLWKSFLSKAFLEAKTSSNFEEKLRTYMATETQNLSEYLDSATNVSVVAFYNVALQLLKFNPDVDFSFDAPLTAMKKIQLLIANHQNGYFTTSELKSAWYWLLATHNKDGQTFIDSLASKGYFTTFYGKVSKPLLFNGKTLPVFNPHKLIREVVYVESPQDSDHDGKRDLLKAEILRPYETEHGLKVPVLYTASPYNQGTNDETGEKLTHNVNVPLTHKEPNNLQYKDIEYVAKRTELPEPRVINGETKKAEETFARESSYTLNDYFLARGFAVIYMAGIGTKDSDGFRTTGDPDETTSTISIIKWLTGDLPAFTNRTDNIEIKAWWSNKKVAMTGRSYLGTLATAAATTGVKGLKTIISEAAISNWYDYYRDGGLVIAPGGFPGEDADVLAEETFSRRLQPGDFHKIEDQWDQQIKDIQVGQDRDSGDYNTFWDARNYHKNFKNITADVFMVHGLNDWNVKPRNVERLWNGIKYNGVTQKIILHQGQHIYINAFRSIDYSDIINLWLTNELLGIDNQAKEIIPNVIRQDNVKPETWTAYKDWANEDDDTLKYNLSDDKLTTEKSETATASFTDNLPKTDFEFYRDDNVTWQKDLLADNAKLLNTHLTFKTAPLTKNLLLDGKIKLNLQVSSSEDLGMLSFQVIDFGKTKRLNVSPSLLSKNSLAETYDWREDDLREFTLGKESTAKMITKGHINLQNRKNNYKVDELKPNIFYNVTVDLQPTFYNLQANHQLGLIIYATDFGMTVRGNQNIKYTVQLDQSTLIVPLHK
ncbi:Xaa-Pro dipeptidyl-peptidase [Companilactobacillus alimentarius]|uniref:Xaa-Pro dipeptidyl-peptidase n=1 Tax=Companilactobacillus alimentarius DSM 20249 TaxID=1423720 RepID=A0A2K9HRR1_9LACO|nr:Xaa-Pro dipeptidyl-peptidase [Companilactobacillus alimentarius]AUI72672.1 Xaa-Pro dipeptidyl-peptidase [Companilactobacillus alimentarius DSM 20249]KRK75639.1 x-prolyl-dipeptidyl aminopeptidase [Companilactobacillus alimentarius DSM 20249]MDT6952167.1 Xaa-Pro dipeptidyl-peptidase [Companilactobacillus alimentarius]GEO45403.1 Xaa-Pro dipeptidyl-peptidase [Companilactobacillus alimentarius]